VTIHSPSSGIAHPSGQFRFAAWTLDQSRGSLAGPAGDIALRPKSLEVLHHLLVNPGRLLSRDDLLEAVWSGVTVTEESLTQCVSEIRHALSDGEQTIIKTVPRRGYIFTLPVDFIAETSPPLPGGAHVDVPAPTPAKPLTLSRPAVVVLPFTNLSGDPEQDYLSDGLTEDLIAGLSQFSDLAVIARQSAFSFKGQTADVRDVSRTLDARYVVEGSIRRHGDRIRVSARLIDGDVGSQRWAERFDRTLGDFNAVMDDITQAIVRVVVAHVGVAEEERVTRALPRSATAYDLALRGDFEMRAYLRTWTAAHVYEARKYFEAALKLEPENAKTCAELGHTFVRAYHEPLDDDYTSEPALQRGHDLISKAVALDPFVPLSRAHLGWALLWMRQHDAAIAQFERAIELNPNFLDVRFAAALIYGGESERALGVLNHRMQNERMFSAHNHSLRGHALYILGRYGEAVAPLQENIRYMPKLILARIWLAAVQVSLGQHDAAHRTADEILRLSPGFTLDRWPAFNLYRDAAERPRIISRLREAGLM
jgi:adenylate cyclase